MSAWIAGLESGVAAWLTLLVPRAIEAAVLGVLLILIARMAPRLPSSARHGLLLIALAKFLLPPVAAPWGPRWAIPDLGLGAAGAAVAAPVARPLEAAVRAGDSAATVRGERAVGPGFQFGAPLAAGRPAAATGLAPTLSSSVSTGLAPVPPAPTAADAAALRRPATVPRIAPVVWIALLQLVAGCWLLGRRSAQRRSLRAVVARCEVVGERTLRRTLHDVCDTQQFGRVPWLLASPDGFGPAAAGVREPKIILPTLALDRLGAERLRGVIAHEVAHHRRRDLWVDCAVFLGSLVWWFHPVYWLVAREIRRVREDCCDELALAATTPASYCQTLIDIAAALGGRPAPLPAGAHGSHAHPLSRRIRRMMNPQFRPGGSLPRVGLAALACVALLAAPTFSTFATPAPAPPQQNETHSWGRNISWGVRNGVIQISRGAIDELVERGMSRAFVEQLDGSTDRELTPDELRTWRQNGFDPELAAELDAIGIRTMRTLDALRLVWSDVDAAYVRGLREVGYTGISVGDISRLARYEVSPAFVGDFKQQGFDDLSVDDLVRLKRYEVEPGYAGTYRAAGYDLSVDDLVRLNRYEVDEHAAARLAEAGIDDLSVDDLVRLRRYEVGDDFVRAMTEDGEHDLSVDDLVRLSRYEVDADYAARVRAQGLQASTDDLVKLRRYEVDPGYIEALRGLGFSPSIDDLVKMQRYEVSIGQLEGLAGSGYTGLTVDDVVRMQRYEVSADWVRALADATSRRFSVDELVNLKRYEVSAEFVRGLDGVGLANVGVSDLIRLKRYEVDPGFIRRLQDAGFADLTIDKIIRLKRAEG